MGLEEKRMDPLTEEARAGARAYEALHVPALFREWVEPVLDAARVGPGQRVVDVACGTGVLARGARERVGTSGSVVGIDVDPGMLAVAREIDPSIEWRQGEAEKLPFDDASFDAVVSQFGLMFFSDRSGAAREMFRVLQENGRTAAAVWDDLANQPAYATEVELLDAIAGKAAGDALRAPFALGDAHEACAIFEAAGFEDVQATTRRGTGRFPDIRTLVGADLHGWLPVMGVHLEPEVIEEILETAESEMARFVIDGEVVFDAPGHLITGTKP